MVQLVSGLEHAKPVTSAQFVAWLIERRREETLGQIAASLGVSVMAIQRWCKGKRRVSRPVLLLAGCLMSQPRELSSGLPDGPAVGPRRS